MDEQNSKQVRRFRFRKRYVPMLLLAAMAGGYLFWRAHLNSEIRTELERIRAEGYPATPEEVSRAYTARGSEEVGADYLKAFATLGKPTETQEQIIPIFQGAEWPAPDVAIPGELIIAIDTYLQQNQLALELLQLAASKGDCRYPIDLMNPIDADLTHLGGVSDSVDLLDLKAIQSAELKQGAEAVDALIARIAVSDSIQHEPIYWSQVARSLHETHFLEVFEQVIGRCDRLAREDVSRLASVLNRPLKDTRWERALAGERVACLDLFWNPTRVNDLWTIDQTMSSGGIRLRQLTGIHDLDLLTFLRLNRLNIEIVRTQPPQDWDYSAYTDLDVPEFYFISKLALSSPIPIETGDLETQRRANQSIAITALAAYRYKLDHNRWPNTLDELVGEYLDALPLDVYNDNQPLKMKRVEDGLLIYSVGDDEVDDGGDGEAQADIVFRLNR